MTEEQTELIASATRCVGSLPDLCSPMGALTILPSVLWLVTGVLKEAASGHQDLVDVAATPPQVGAALHSLKVIQSSQVVFSSRRLQDHFFSPQLEVVLLWGQYNLWGKEGVWCP